MAAAWRHPRIVAAAVLALLPAVLRASSIPGMLELDEYTFEKVVLTPHTDVLVRFDKEFTFGRAHEVFKRTVEQVNEEKTRPDFLIAALPVKDYGDRLHADIARKFGVDLENLPVFKLFKRNGEIVTFTGNVEREGDLANFVKFDCGVYLGLEGTIEEFEPLAARFLAAADKAALLDEARALLEDYLDAELEGSAIYYVKVMEKLMENPGYAATELKRVRKVLGAKVSVHKKIQMHMRTNILTSFLGKDAAAAAPDDDGATADTKKQADKAGTTMEL